MEHEWHAADAVTAPERVGIDLKGSTGDATPRSFLIVLRWPERKAAG